MYSVRKVSSPIAPAPVRLTTPLSTLAAEGAAAIAAGVATDSAHRIATASTSGGVHAVAARLGSTVMLRAG